MRAILLGLLLIVLAAVACSDRVPAPVTPTPSPRPGYPPAPVTALPEGMLLVQQPSSVAPLLFGLDSNGEARPYVRTPFVSVSPDGSRAAAWTQESNLAAGFGILTGSGYEEIAGGPWTTGSPMSLWSADGSQLAYTIPDDAAGGKVHVWTLDVESGETTRTTAEADFYGLLGWTAADEVLVSTPDGLALLGEAQRRIDLPEPGAVVDAKISPDGRSVAVKLGTYEQSAETELTSIRASGIWVLGLTGGGWREILDLADEAPEVQTRRGQEMLWSPDNRRISYHSPQVPGYPLYQLSLNVVDVFTGKRQHLRDNAIWIEAWSDDGRYFAYVYENSAAERRLGMLGPDGRTSETDILVRRLAWTKDGSLLVDIPGHLSLLDPLTVELNEVLTDTGETISALLEAPVWSPSGRYFALSTPADVYHRSSLYVIDAETGTAALFLDEAGFSAAAWLRE